MYYGLRRVGKALARRAYWGIAKRVPNRLVAFRAPGGRLYLDITDSPAMVKRVLHLYERPKRRALEQALRSGMTFIDVGANIGDFSLVAARRVGPSGRVFAIEPHPDNAAQIRRSVELNGYEQVQVRTVALGATAGQAALHLGDRAAWHTLVPGLKHRSAGVVDVPVMTLDSLALEVGGPVHAVKIDVEGAEALVLQGGAKTLRRNRDVELLIDLHPHLGVDLQEVEHLLTAWGFSFFDVASDRPLAGLPVGAGEVRARRV